MFDRAKAIKEAFEMKRQIAAQRVTVDEDGVRVVVNGEMKILELKITGANDDAVKEKINKAFKEVQNAVAQNMAGSMGNLSDLMGQLKM